MKRQTQYLDLWIHFLQKENEFFVKLKNSSKSRKLNLPNNYEALSGLANALNSYKKEDGPLKAQHHLACETIHETLAFWGKNLYDCLFTEREQNLEKKQYEGIRLYLIFAKKSPLRELPWEWLHNGNDFLCLTDKWHLIRCLENAPSTNKEYLAPKGPIMLHRLNENDLDFKREAKQINKHIATVPCYANLEELEEKWKGSNLSIYHFQGHGAADEAGRGGIILENSRSETKTFSADALIRIFSDQSPTLCIFTACNTGRPNVNKPFADGLADSLLMHGIPAIVAMSHEINNGASLDFSKGFYKHFEMGLEAAISKGRQTIYTADPNGMAWTLPCLFLNHHQWPTIAKPEPKKKTRIFQYVFQFVLEFIICSCLYTIYKLGIILLLLEHGYSALFSIESTILAYTIVFLLLASYERRKIKKIDLRITFPALILVFYLFPYFFGPGVHS